MLLKPKTSQKLIMVGLTLMAFALRIYRLDFQSYWIDETWTVYFAHLSPAELWRLLQTVEVLPPLYHPTTIYYIKLFGDSEYALRFYSLLFGVMAAPFTYRLGKDLGDTRLGLIAALLMAVAPFQIWHSQEARMYSILTAASVMSMWGFVNVWRRGGWRWWLVYIIGTLWAINTHYHGAVLIGIQGLFLLITWQRHWRGYLRWGAALLLMLALLAPWLLVGGNLLQSYLNWVQQPTLGQVFLRSAIAYSLNDLLPRSQALWLMLPFVIAYLLGLAYATRRRWGAWRGWEMLALLLSYTIAPPIAAWLYGLLRTPVYLERYLILVQVGYLLTVAMGVLAIVDLQLPIYDLQFFTGRFRLKTSALLAGALLLILLGINGEVLHRYYTDPVYARPNWRGVAQTIANFELPGDAILLTGDGGEHAFNYYYRGQAPVRHDFNLLPPTHPDHKKGRRNGPDEVPQIMHDLAANYRRLWFSPYGVDIDPLLERWLAENAYPAWHSWLGRKRLALYNLQPPAGRTERPNTTFADALGAGPTLTEIALPNAPVTAGDLLPLQLTWQTGTPLARDYQLSLRLINQHSDVFAQSDWPPLAATSAWATQQPTIDKRSLWIPPDIPPGDYLLQLVIYDPAGGQTLGQPFNINNIAIDPAPIIVPPEFLSIPNATQNPKLETRNLNLLGYALPAEIQPGQEMWLWLYWQALSPLNSTPTLSLTLSGDDLQLPTTSPLTESVGPLNSWQAGQVRRAVYHLPTSPRLTGDSADIIVRLNSAQGIETEATIAQVKLNSRPRQFEAPAMAQPAQIAFGDTPLLTLIGYDLTGNDVKSGNALPVTLYWQGNVEMETNYTVFIQLLNDADQVVAQIDAQPQAGAAPTATWLPGEIVTDSYRLPLSTELPPGRYRLIAGLYNAATGQRLPASTGVDFVELGQVTVK